MSATTVVLTPDEVRSVIEELDGASKLVVQLLPERGQVRLDLGEASRATLRDIFAETSVRRVETTDHAAGKDSND